MNNFLIIATAKKSSSNASGLVLILLFDVVALIVWAPYRRKRSVGPRHIDNGFSMNSDDAEMDSFRSDDGNQTFGEPIPSGDVRMDALTKAVDLYERGFLTDEEFSAEKQRIMGA